MAKKIMGWLSSVWKKLFTGRLGLWIALVSLWFMTSRPMLAANRLQDRSDLYLFLDRRREACLDAVADEASLSVIGVFTPAACDFSLPLQALPPRTGSPAIADAVEGRWYLAAIKEKGAV